MLFRSSAGAYKQHINEKDFNQIFKHENKPAPQPVPKSGSPFEQMLKPEVKPAPAVASKPPVVPAKPVAAATAATIEAAKPRAIL